MHAELEFTRFEQMEPEASLFTVPDDYEHHIPEARANNYDDMEPAADGEDTALLSESHDAEQNDS